MKLKAEMFFWIATLTLFAIYLAMCVALYNMGGIFAALLLVSVSIIGTYIVTRVLSRNR